MQVSVCVGDYAETPYYVPELETCVYCMEEFCYCLRENAFLLDTSLLDDGLADWIEEECGLKDLADELRSMLNKQVTLSSFVTFILEYVMLYDTETIREVGQAVKSGSGLSGIEKRKNQIDYLVRKKKYPAAIHRYDELLYKWEMMDKRGEETQTEKETPAGKDIPAGKIMATILHNKGVALTGMMEYGAAAQCFLQAYETDALKVYYETYLTAKRLELSDNDYVAFIADLPSVYEISMQLEKDIEQACATFEEQEVGKMLRMRKEYRYGGSRQKYYDESDGITQKLKISYRNSVSE